jgi:hypothetical protein
MKRREIRSLMSSLLAIALVAMMFLPAAAYSERSASWANARSPGDVSPSLGQLSQTWSEVRNNAKLTARTFLNWVVGEDGIEELKEATGLGFWDLVNIYTSYFLWLMIDQEMSADEFHETFVDRVISGAINRLWKTFVNEIATAPLSLLPYSEVLAPFLTYNTWMEIGGAIEDIVNAMMWHGYGPTTLWHGTPYRSTGAIEEVSITRRAGA